MTAARSVRLRFSDAIAFVEPSGRKKGLPRSEARRMAW
jgi:hypothetical protein